MTVAAHSVDRHRDDLLQNLEQLIAGEWRPDARDAGPVWSVLAAPWKLIVSTARHEPDVLERRAAEIEDSGRAEQRVRSDYSGRYPIELLQNAQDACADAGIRGRAWFRVSDTALLVANQGVSFDRQRVSALLRLGGSSKRVARAGAQGTIGYKGIGFTSVFELSDRPQIISGELSFGFDRQLALQEVQRRLGASLASVAARYYPLPLTPRSWSEDLALVQALFDLGASTVVRLPFRRTVDRELAGEALNDTLSATSLVLMPALDALDVEGVGSWRRNRGRRLALGRVHHVKTGEGKLVESWLLTKRRVSVANDTINALEDEPWAGVQDLEVSVGIPWRRGKPDAKGPCPPLHVYFPTNDAVGRKLLLHGDFYLDSTRRHVQTEGPGSAITELAMRAIADLAADSALELNRHLPGSNETLVDILSPREEPEGFGAVLASALDEKLADTSFLRSVTDAALAPARCQVLDVSLQPRTTSDFVAMMDGAEALASPNLKESVRGWLVRLGATKLSAEDIIAKLRPERARTYDRAIRAVRRWWQSAHRWSDDITPLAVLQSTEGEWLPAAALCRQAGDYPRLPTGLELATYRPPRARDTREFIDSEFNVREIDAQVAFDHVMASIGTLWQDQDASRLRELHDFARAVFSKAPQVVSKHRQRSALPVPVRKWRRGSTVGWARAGAAYFPQDWTENRDLETLYGAFGEREFLAVPKPARELHARDLERFYSAIGVADMPRQVAVTDLWKAPPEWRKLKEVVAAQRCPDGHPQSARVFRALVVDRLPELLRDIDLRRARALVSVLARSDAPYGAHATIRCGHSSHRGSQRRNRVSGPQRWHLENSSWVPLRSRAGHELLGQPADAWTHVNTADLRACVTLADVSPKDASRLDLPRMTQPPATALCDTMQDLYSRFPDFASAPVDIRAGAEQLLRKLEAATKPGELATSSLGVFPARRMGEPVWSQKPAVPDLLLPEDLDLEVLPAGKWANLREAFSLPLASACVESRTDFRGLRVARVYRLSLEDRAALAAILHSKGSDLRRVSRELGRLTVKEADEITTVFTAGPSRSALRPSVHLEKQADESALMVIAPSANPKPTFEVARRLAEYLSRDASAEAMIIYLEMRTQCLTALGVTEGDLQEARNAISRYRRTDEHQEEPTVQQVPEIPATDPHGLQADVRSTATAAFPPTNPEKPAGARSTFGPRSPAAGGGRKRFTDATGLPVATGSGRTLTGAEGGTGRSGSPSLPPEARKDIEERAIQIAIDYARDHLHAVEVRDVQLANKGWDLEIVFDDGTWWPLEVKGFGMTASRFILTKNELEAAKREEHYRLLLVTGVWAASGQVLYLEHPAAVLDSADLAPLSWVITSWQNSVTTVTDWSDTPE